MPEFLKADIKASKVPGWQFPGSVAESPNHLMLTVAVGQGMGESGWSFPYPPLILKVGLVTYCDHVD